MSEARSAATATLARNEDHRTGLVRAFRDGSSELCNLAVSALCKVPVLKSDVSKPLCLSRLFVFFHVLSPARFLAFSTRYGRIFNPSSHVPPDASPR